jgi:hypothetical protein
VGVSINQPFEIDFTSGMGAVGPVTVNGSFGSVGPVSVTGIPDTYYFNVDKLPQIDIKFEPVTLEPITYNPIPLNLSIKEIPSTRTHLPANYSVGVSLLGVDVLCIRLCGEAQVITEPYIPNPCEVCGVVPPLLTQRPPTVGIRASRHVDA